MSCSYNDCQLVQNAHSNDHFNRYHTNITQTIQLEGANFYVRRDPSVDYKYVCLCGSSYLNRYAVGHHIAGSGRSPGCLRMYEKALEIVATNAVFMDETNELRTLTR